MTKGYKIDNRDMYETWLWLDGDGSQDAVRVDPWELVENVIENVDLEQGIKDKLVLELFGLRDRLDKMTQ